MMNRIFVSVLLLSIAGGVVSLFFIATEKLIYKFTSAKFVVWLNTAVLFTFVIPFYKIISYWGENEVSFANTLLVVGVKPETLKQAFYYSIENSNFEESIVAVWAAGVILFLMLRIVQYQLLCKKIEQNHFLVFNEQWLEVWSRLYKNEQGVQNVRLIASTLFNQPCVSGLRQKSVIIPAKLLNDISTTDIEFLLGHELMHIKRKDVPLKLFIIALNSLNWFNPVFYILEQSLFEWIELGCDEELLATYSSKQKKNYMHLLIQMMIGEYGNSKGQYVSFFTNADARNLKRRVYGIMKGNGKRASFARKAAVSSFMVCAVAGSSVIAKAADVPVNSVFSGNIDVMEEGTYSVVDYEMEQQKNEVSYNNLDTEKSTQDIKIDKIKPLSIDSNIDVTYTIITNDGTETQINTISTETRHRHDTETITLKEHVKYKDGSCKTTYYGALQCTTCDAVWIEDVIEVNTKDPCNH